jgi:acid phosphatase family membrane protein YuiD
LRRIASPSEGGPHSRLGLGRRRCLPIRRRERVPCFAWGPPSLAGLYLWLITNLVWTAVSAAAAAQPIHLFVDEGWHLLQYAGTAAELGAMARRFRKHYAAIHLATQFGQDLARNSDAEVIHDAVGIVTLFEQCMLRCKAGLQNLYNSINDLLERNGLQSTNLRHHQAMTGRE